MQRRRDGEYRINEYDPQTVHRLAVELLKAFAKDPGAAQIADLEEYLPDIRWLAPGGGERDDLMDAIYEACGQAVIAVPNSEQPAEPQWAIEVLNKISGRTEIVVKPNEASARRSYLDAQRRGTEGAALLRREVGPWIEVEVDR